jgi:hypothetical protein
MPSASWSQTFSAKNKWWVVGVQSVSVVGINSPLGSYSMWNVMFLLIRRVKGQIAVNDKLETKV